MEEQTKNHALTESLLNDGLATKLPNTELVKKLLNARERYVAQGGKLYTADEINDEVHKNRGG